MQHKIKVTRIGNWWHVRCWYDVKLIVEYKCNNRLDIGWCCRQAMRDCDKYYTGGDAQTGATRKRMFDTERYSQAPVGKIKNITIDNREYK